MHRGIICPGSAVNKAHPLNRGLVSWWLNLPNRIGGGGATFRDLMGRNHGTLTNGPRWQGPVGRPGGMGSLKFDGVNQYVTSSDARLPTSSAARTIVMSVYRVDSSAAYVRWGVDSGVSEGFIWTPGHVSHVYTDGVDESNGGDDSSLPTGRWLHLAFTMAGGSGIGTAWAYYLDGLPRASGMFATTVATVSDGTLDIGRRVRTGGYLNGWVDSVGIYDRSLSATEVFALYNNSRQGYPQTLNRLRTSLVFDTGAAPGGTAFPWHYYQQLMTG